MNTVLIQAALNVILALAQQYLTSDTAQKIIDLAKQLLPLLIGEFADLKPIVMAIIGVVRGSDALTDDQKKEIDDMIAQADIEFDEAAADFNKRAHPEGGTI